MLAQRFAYDLLRVDGNRSGMNLYPGGGLRAWTLGVRTSEIYGWGQPVHAALDGEVVTTSDGMPEHEWLHPIRELAGVIWTGITYDPAKRGFGPVAGNHVVVRSGDSLRGLRASRARVGRGQGRRRDRYRRTRRSAASATPATRRPRIFTSSSWTGRIR